MSMQVYNGMTQLGYESSHREFRYGIRALNSFSLLTLFFQFFCPRSQGIILLNFIFFMVTNKSNILQLQNRADSGSPIYDCSCFPFIVGAKTYY